MRSKPPWLKGRRWLRAWARRAGARGGLARNLCLGGCGALLLASQPQCARVVAPTGGPRDLDPPRVVRTNPPNGSAGVRQRTLRIYMSEYVSLQDPQKHIVVSPPLPTPANAVVQGRSVLLRLGDSLRPNTTYSVQFGKSVVDLTERNPLPPYVYAFSTGASVDTCWLAGYARDALLQSPKDKALAMLYRHDDDSAATDRIPDFVAQADEQGQFLFTNLPPGQFWLASLVEKQGNMRYDNLEEEIGFVAQPVDSECLRRVPRADSTVASPDSAAATPRDTAQAAQRKPLAGVRVESFRQKWQRQQLLRAVRPAPDQLLFIFAHRNQLPVTAALRQEPSLQLVHEAMGDTVRYWIMDTAAAQSDTLQVVLTHTSRDTTNTVCRQTDTLRMALPRPSPPKDGRSSTHAQDAPQRPPLGLDLSCPSWVQFVPGDSITITLAAPPVAVDTGRMAIRQLPDSTLRPFRLLRHAGRPRRFTLLPDLHAHHAWQVELLPGAFVDAQHRTNDTLRRKAEMANPARRCIVRIALRNAPSPSLVQLIAPDANKLTKYQQVSPTGHDTVTFRYVEAGGYGVRIVEDANANGQWDTGDYYSRRQPERVRYFVDGQGQSSLQVRANWEYDFSIDYAALPQ